MVVKPSLESGYVLRRKLIPSNRSDVSLDHQHAIKMMAVCPQNDVEGSEQGTDAVPGSVLEFHLCTLCRCKAAPQSEELGNIWPIQSTLELLIDMAGFKYLDTRLNFCGPVQPVAVTCAVPLYTEDRRPVEEQHHILQGARARADTSSGDLSTAWAFGEPFSCGVELRRCLRLAAVRGDGGVHRARSR